jgi:hypothetical protein
MTIFEFLNLNKNQALYFSDERFYAYGNVLLNYESGELITLNNEETIAKQLKVTEFPFNIKDISGKQIYQEFSDGFWWKLEYNDNESKFENSKGYIEIVKNNNVSYRKYEDGSWDKYEYEYNTNSKVIKCENSNGKWNKKEYDDKSNQIYYEDSLGFWWKKEYHERNLIRYENSLGKTTNTIYSK